jgi:hypothetical protein
MDISETLAPSIANIRDAGGCRQGATLRILKY